MSAYTSRLTQAFIHLDRLDHNLRMLQAEVGNLPLWPVVKADAYGHGSVIVARHLVESGYRTLGVADIGEAAALADAGIGARVIVLSATLPEHAEAIVAYGCEPVVCTYAMADVLAQEASRAEKAIAVHLKVDTGMGRLGIRPASVPAFLEHCSTLPGLRVRGIMSHFARADEADKEYSLEQIERFHRACNVSAHFHIEVRHMANSAGILDLPGAHFDAVRPGIAMYGLYPSAQIANPRVRDLQPVLEWRTRVVFLKEVPVGTGLSYGHSYHTPRPSLIATLPVGYGDGLSRELSDRLEVLIQGVRCPQVGRITMDMSLVDVTALRGGVAVGDVAVIIGRQGTEEVTADELAAKLATINYEIVTGIGHRVPRVVVEPPRPDPDGAAILGA
jgi:alanine racemase